MACCCGSRISSYPAVNGGIIPGGILPGETLTVPTNLYNPSAGQALPANIPGVSGPLVPSAQVGKDIPLVESPIGAAPCACQSGTTVQGFVAGIPWWVWALVVGGLAYVAFKRR